MNNCRLRLGIYLMSGIFATSFAFAENTLVLKNHVLPQIRNSVKLGRPSADEVVPLSLVIKLDASLLAQTLDQLYGPSAPKHKHFLSSGEFAQRFGLIDKRKKLEAFAQANGLTLNPTDNRPGSMLVKVSGRADVVEKAFGIQFNRYRAADGRVFRAHETDPRIPVALEPHLGAVLGLSNLTGVFHPHFRLAPAPNGTAARARAAAGVPVQPTFLGTGPGYGLAPADIKTIYGLNPLALNGSGQTVALFELDGFNPSDIIAYEHQFSLPAVPTTFVGVDGTLNLCNGVNCSAQNPDPTTGDPAMVEVVLDIEMVAAIAPGVSQILVYDGPNTEQGCLDAYNQIATDDTAQAVSTSWGSYESNEGWTFLQAESQIFQRMAAQGQSNFAAAGDNGAYDDLNNPTTLEVDDPASQPYVTGVGGTSLSGTIQNPVETTWNDGMDSSTGGGVSAYWSIPGYQSGIAGLASPNARNVPDVALNADPYSGYSVYVGGTIPGWYIVGGTSAAAPLWTAFAALLNQESASVGNSVLGFANPVLYQQAAASDYHSLYNDITSGNNNYYSAGVGYDNTTGWGSCKGDTLIESITGQLATILANQQLDSLANVYPYPNPWDVRKSPPSTVKIANVPPGATVKVFTVSGFHVEDLPIADNEAVWDLKNSGGQSVASGLYLYFVNFGGKTVRGKIAVIK